MNGLIVTLTLPLFILNAVGGLVGGIWLLVLGRWQLVGMGLGWAFIAPLFLGLLMTPGMLIAAVGFSGGKFRMFIMSALGTLWLGALMVGITTVIFGFAATAADTDGNSVIPYLLLAYGAAVSPWAYMAQRGHGAPSDADWSFVPLLSLQFAAIAGGIAILVAWPLTVLDLGLVIASVFGGLALVLLLLAVAGERGARRGY